MGIFCKVCLRVGEGHDKEQLRMGGCVSLFRRTVSSWSRRCDSTTLKWGRARCVQKMWRKKKTQKKMGRSVNPKSLAGCRHLMARRPEYRCCSLLQRASREQEGKGTFAKPPGLAWRESDAANSKSLELAGSSGKRQFWLYRFPHHRWDFFFLPQTSFILGLHSVTF